PGPDGLPRCPWSLSAEDYRAYHDTEWGRPVRGDRELFERLTLEAFQSGLSWLTILRRREGFRAAFGHFRIATVAAFGPQDVTRLLADPGIIRNRAKIEATLHNARVLTEWPEGRLTDLIWSRAPGPRP
ncbi:DNA-3-methyladenine glycosylase I, partial [Streptomyces calidiresistens]